MLTGLDILLDRMKTNPDEFLVDGRMPYEGQQFGGKWSDLLNYAWRVANEEEQQALDVAIKQFYRDDFNGRVMKRLAGEETAPETLTFRIGQAQIRAQGQQVGYGASDSSDAFGYALGSLVNSGIVGSGSS